MPQTPPKSPFEFTGGNLCLDFADTVENRAGEHPRELLIDYPRLLQWAEEAGITTKKIAERLRGAASEAPGNAQTALRHAVQLRDAIYDVFSAVARHRTIPSSALAVLNHAIQQAAQHAVLSQVNRRFVWEWTELESSLNSMLWPVARAAADLLSSEDVAHVRECASETCAWLFLDKTKNHRRRWCDMKTCGNRDKARRYYQRQKAGGF